MRSDIELAMGRAYEASGDKQKATDAFRNVYFNIPDSFEAEAAGAELRKLGISGSVAERRTRADLLFKGKHYGEAASDYRELLNEVVRAEPNRDATRSCHSFREERPEPRCARNSQLVGACRPVTPKLSVFIC